MEFRAGANLFAYLVLVAFVPLTVMTFGRLGPATAAAAMALAGCLFLPELAAFDLELMPPIGKEAITYLAILVGAVLHQSRRLGRARPGRGPEAILLLIAVANVGTAWINLGPVSDGTALIPGLSAYSVVSITVGDVLRYGLPFFLGRALFTTERDLRVLLTVIAGAGLVYALFILAEIGLSAVFRVFQFGQRVYGTFTAIPEWRYGGIRPVVFMMHPLAVSIFMATSAIAAAGIAKARFRVFRLSAGASCGFLLFVLVLCRNVASVVFAVSITFLITLLRPRAIAAVALGLAALVVTYPALRTSDLFPHRELLELAEGFDPERARSLAGRFDEEDEVLGKARDHLWLGWGEFTRIRAHQEGLDGFWIIVVGIQGIVGLELRFALILLPIVVGWRMLPRVASARDRTLLATLMAIVAIRAVDLLPNGWWTNLTVFLAGALFNLARSVGRARRRGPQEPASSNRRNAPRSTLPFAFSGSSETKRISRGSM